MIEFIRRSLIEKALEGEMKIISAGYLTNESFEGTENVANFTISEGKTTLTIVTSSIRHFDDANSTTPTYVEKAEGILKGSGRIVYPDFYWNSEGICLATITSSEIKISEEMDINTVSYIIFEIDE